ncbi:MAG TPA: hypothetical protein VM121_02015 [Acidimicrobiales bacterium]|nr:hypothetical protein [Acidimicrobiales bacterium]
MRAGSSRWTVAVALSLLVAVGLTACSDDKDEKAESTDTTTAVKGSPTMSVDMTDYAYTVSGPLTVGGTIKIANKGKEFHMMSVGKLKPGKTLADFQTALQNADPNAKEDPTAALVEQMGLPGNFMGPGQSADLTVPSLAAGTYAMSCFVPTEGEGTPHFAKGMISEFTVVDGSKPAAPTADATYKIATGKAIEGPATLTAGSHTLKFEAASGSEQLEPGIAKLNAGTTIEQFIDTFQVFGGETPPPANFASQVPGELVFVAFDLGKITEFYLKVNVTAGNYAIDAADTDAPNVPTPHKEVLNITVS